MKSGEPAGRDRAASDESILASLLDELTETHRRGELPDIDQVASRHPALADDLRMLWATVWIAEEMARTGPGDVGDSEPVLMPTTSNEPVADRDHGQLFGEYELFEELGRGGMGVVSRALEVKRQRIVAIKRLLHGPSSTAEDIERFRVEALAASKLGHPHIVPVFQVGNHDDQPFFTMRYVEWTTLAR